MPSPAEFPLPSVSGSNPRYESCTQQAPDYQIGESPEYQDGGKDFNLDAATPTRRWALVYDGLTLAEAAILDAHFDSAYGEAFGFNFRDPKTTTLYSAVHYEKDGYEKSHTKDWLQRRVIKLIKRP
jgi:hypothetical protein